MVKFVSPRGALPRIFGLPPEPQCFGPPEGGRRPDLLFLVAVDTFQHCFLGRQSLCFGSHEFKRHLLLERKAMTNLDSVLKSRDITLPTSVPIVKAMVFPVVMYRCESWTIKEAEHQKIDVFELWCWRRL